MKAKNKRIYYHVFPFGLWVFFNTPYKDIRKKLKKVLKKRYIPEISKFKGDYCARTLMVSGGQTIIVFNKWDSGTIAHEALHAVQFLFDRIGIDHGYDSYEAYAYMLQYLVDGIHSARDGKV